MSPKYSFAVGLTLALAYGSASAAPLSPSVQMVISPALNPTLRAAPSYGNDQRADQASGGQHSGGGMPVIDMHALKQLELQAEKQRREAAEQQIAPVAPTN